jgi:glycosyltransferase involved in cell wall biosynthesis
MLAEALAIAGHDVNYVTNALPVFFKDFERFAAHDKIKTTITPNFLVDMSGEKVDAVIVTPGRSDHPIYYNAARMAAMWSGAQLILINFESGNWFNSLAPQKRDLADWDHWKRVISQGGTVLSSARESDRWARDFYTENPDKTRFAVWSPSINSAAADAAPDVLKEKRAVIISRLSDPHKGMQSILEILPDEMAGWTLTIISGTPEVNEGFLSDLREMAGQRGITLDFSFRPDDVQKFVELKRARILIFPSLFEGYGYPPIEALYCNTEVVSYDLPVVKETCGNRPYYAPHGDRAALKDALRNAILDPQSGERDHHSEMRELAHIEPAAKRLIEMLEREIAPENRTTNLTLTEETHQNSKSFKDALPAPLRTFLAKQRTRLKRLGTVEGRKSYMKRVGLSGQESRSTERRLSVSEATVSEMGVLSVRGWRLGGARADRMEAKIGNKLLIPGKLRMSRPDILKTYPQYKDDKAGFEVSGRFVSEDLLNEPVEILFYKGDTLIDRAGTVVAPAKTDALNWLLKNNKAAKAAQGRSFVILADLDHVRLGTKDLYDILNIAAACKAADLLPTLLVRGDEATFAPHQAFLAKHFTEIVLADASKPAQKPHAKPQLSDKLIAVEKALVDIQANRMLAGLIAFGEGLSEAHSVLEEGARKLVYLGENLSAKEPDADTIIVSPNKSVLTEYAGHDTILLPLHPSAYGDVQEPIYGVTELVMPATGDIELLEEAWVFARKLSETYPSLEANIRLLGIEGQADLAPEKVGNLTVFQMGPASDNDVLYTNATAIIAPFFNRISEDAGTVLKRTLAEAAVFGRPILVADQMAELLPKTARSLRFEQIDAALRGLLDIVDDTSDKSKLMTSAGYAQVKADPLLAYREFAAITGSLVQPSMIVKARGSDERVYASVNALFGLNPEVREQASVRVLIGDDLATANAVIANLRTLKIAIEGFHSRSPEVLSGLLDEDREITRPVSNSDVPYILATLDPHEAEAWDYLIDRLGGRSVSLVPMVRAHDRSAFEVLHLSAAARDVQIYDAYVATDWSKRAKGKTVRIATDNLLMNSDFPDWSQKQVDILVCTNPRYSDAAKARLLAQNPAATIIIAAPMGGIAAATDQHIVRYDAQTQPWSDAFLAQLPALEGEGEALELAHKLAHWMGGNITRIRATEAV